VSDSDKESDEPDNQDQNISDIEGDSDDGDDGPVGISLDDILEGEQNEDRHKKKLAWLDAPESEKPCKKGQKSYSDEFSASDLFIKMSLYGIMLSGWYFVVHYFNAFLEETPSLARESEITASFLTFMTIISYYKCSNVSTINPSKNAPSFVSKNHVKECKYCEKWKPERTHHCSRCGQCVLRMDHHCPWICNCVGYKNHKAFFLFCFYTGIASFYFDYKAVSFFIKVIGDGDFMEISGLLFIISLACLFIIFPLGIFTFGLSVFHFMLAMNNLTTLENISGITLFIPSFKRQTKPQKIINKYDQGKLANLWNFFGKTYTLWWWPTIPSTLFEGQSVDEFVMDNSDKVLEYMQLEDENDEFGLKSLKPKSLKEVDLKKLFSIAEEEMKEKQIKIEDKILQNQIV